jgi:hypothetical protein
MGGAMTDNVTELRPTGRGEPPADDDAPTIMDVVDNLGHAISHAGAVKLLSD